MNQYLTSEVKRGAMYSAIIGIVIGIIGVIPILNCLAAPITCIVGLVLPVAIGWFVAQWSRATDAGNGAVLGAFAAGLGGLISGIVVALLNLLINVAWSVLGLPTSLSGDASSAAAGLATNIVAMVLGACFGFVITVVMSALFGALGGLLYVLIQGNKKPA